MRTDFNGRQYHVFKHSALENIALCFTTKASTAPVGAICHDWKKGFSNNHQTSFNASFTDAKHRQSSVYNHYQHLWTTKLSGVKMATDCELPPKQAKTHHGAITHMESGNHSWSLLCSDIGIIINHSRSLLLLVDCISTVDVIWVSLLSLQYI